MLLAHTSWCSQPRQPFKWLQPTIPTKTDSAPTMVSAGAPGHEQCLEEERGVVGLLQAALWWNQEHVRRKGGLEA
jgi:hypothetical protein